MTVEIIIPISTSQKIDKWLEKVEQVASPFLAEFKRMNSLKELSWQKKQQEVIKPWWKRLLNDDGAVYTDYPGPK